VNKTAIAATAPWWKRRKRRGVSQKCRKALKCPLISRDCRAATVAPFYDGG